MRKDRVVREYQLNGETYAIPNVFRPLIGEILGFTDFEAHPDRIERDDSCQWLRGGLRDEAADFDQTIADAARDGRRNGSVTKIQFSRAKKSFGGYDLG